MGGVWIRNIEVLIMGTSGGYFTYPREFNRKTYDFFDMVRTKIEAEKIVSTLRGNKYLARTIKHKNWYVIYRRKK